MITWSFTYLHEYEYANNQFGQNANEDDMCWNLIQSFGPVAQTHSATMQDPKTYMHDYEIDVCKTSTLNIIEILSSISHHCSEWPTMLLMPCWDISTTRCSYDLSDSSRHVSRKWTHWQLKSTHYHKLSPLMKQRTHYNQQPITAVSCLLTLWICIGCSFNHLIMNFHWNIFWLTLTLPRMRICGLQNCPTHRIRITYK